MATLNTLRTKGGVVLAVVIGISLLAFLLGDLASSSGTLFNSSKMTVGEIDGSKVTYQEYLNKVEGLTEAQQALSGTDNLSEQQVEAVRNQAWEQIIRERMFFGSFDKLGLIISDEEALDMADGEYISPILESIFINPQTGIFDHNLMRNFVNNLDQDQTGRARFLWSFLEREMVSERSMEKYMSLVSGGIFVTDIEVEQGVANADNYYNISLVSKRLDTVADSMFSASESELKAYYENHKKQFNQTASRDIEYVVFDALPSEKDYADADAYIKGIAEEFANSADPKQFVALNSQEPFNPIYMSKGDLDASVAEFAFSSNNNSMLGPIFNNNQYDMYRVVDVKELPDSIGAKHIVVAATDKALADSLFAVIKAGKADFSALVTEYSLDKQTPGGNIGRFDPQMMPENISTVLLPAKSGETVMINTPSGIHIMQITYRSPLSQKAQIAKVTYKVESSNQTQQNVYASAVKFASEASSEDFNKAATDSALSKRVARLRAGDRNVQGISLSSEIVRWAFDSKRGDVSSVFTIGESNIVVRVSDAREHGTASFAQVKADILPEVILEKKIAYITNEMSGETSISSLASKLGTEVRSANDVNFNMFYVPELGVAPLVIGAVSTLPQGALSKPMATSVEVVVVELTSKQVHSEATAEQQKLMLKTAAENQIQKRAFDAVYQMSNTNDMRIRFF